MRNGSSAATGEMGSGKRGKQNPDHLHGCRVENPDQHHAGEGELQGAQGSVRPPRGHRLCGAAASASGSPRSSEHFLQLGEAASPPAIVRCFHRSGMIRRRKRSSSSRNPSTQNQVVQERVVRGEDDRNLPRGHNEEAEDAPAPRQKQHEHQAELQHQRGAGGEGVEPVRQVLHVPANPGRQRAVLVVLVHGGEVAPLGDRRWRASPRPTRSKCETIPIAAETGWRAMADARGPVPAKIPAARRTAR